MPAQAVLECPLGNERRPSTITASLLCNNFKVGEKGSEGPKKKRTQCIAEQQNCTCSELGSLDEADLCRRGSVTPNRHRIQDSPTRFFKNSVVRWEIALHKGRQSWSFNTPKI